MGIPMTLGGLGAGRKYEKSKRQRKLRGRKDYVNLQVKGTKIKAKRMGRVCIRHSKGKYTCDLCH
jgi:hypothetical protein